MTQIPNLASSKITQISLTAHDVERATAFYRDRLGLRHLFSVSGMAFFDAGGVRLLLGRPENAQQDHPGSILYFEVPDIQATHAHLESQGVEIVQKPHKVAPMPNGDLWIGFLKDSEGNTLAITSVVPRA